jgi:3-deoxy-D-manno-octulosonic-acid transferase
MILFLYNLLLLLALAVSWPWWLFRFLTTDKYREGMLERLGQIRPEIYWNRAADSRRVIWIHAVSLGEVLAIARLVTELDKDLPKFQVRISTTTRTGQWAARARFGAERVFYCPLDLPWATRAYLNALQPAMLVLAETEFWPNLLSGCYRRGVKVIVVNARISDRSWPRYMRLRRYWKPFLGRLTAVLAQSALDKKRLRILGAPLVEVAGNLKFDVRPGQPSEAVRLLEAARGSARFLVAGSTLDGEEAALVSAWLKVLQADPNLVMVIAPRHPERFAAVTALLEKAGLEKAGLEKSGLGKSGLETAGLEKSGVVWRRRTAFGKSPLAAGEIVLLDTIGELATVYGVATVAFVGGSLVAAGGHNPLEPAQFAVPVVMGPHFENFRAIVETMQGKNAIRIVEADQLANALAGLFQDPNEAAQLGFRGAQVSDEQTGATERSVVVIRGFLEGRS